MEEGQRCPLPEAGAQEGRSLLHHCGATGCETDPLGGGGVARSGYRKGSWEVDAATEAVVVVSCNLCFVCVLVCKIKATLRVARCVRTALTWAAVLVIPSCSPQYQQLTFLISMCWVTKVSQTTRYKCSTFVGTSSTHEKMYEKPQP